MTLIEDAIAKEKAGEYLAAIQIYEKIISEIGAPKDAFINLSFILWEFAAEFSFRVAHNIPPEWGEIGSKKYLLVVEKGLLNFPNSVELLFGQNISLIGFIIMTSQKMIVWHSLKSTAKAIVLFLIFTYFYLIG